MIILLFITRLLLPSISDRRENLPHKNNISVCNIFKDHIKGLYFKLSRSKQNFRMSQEFLGDEAMKQFGGSLRESGWPTGIAALLFSPVTVLANGLVLASILLDPFKNIRSSPSSNLIFSLALADFLVGVLVDPLAAVWNISIACNSSPPFSTSTILFPAIISVGVSLYSLVALSVDRRVAITSPLQHVYRVTKRKIRIAIICIWCYFLFAGILSVVFESYKLIIDTLFTGHLAVPSIIVVVLNIAAIRSIHNQRLNVKRDVGSENSLVLQNAFSREKTVTQTIIMVVAFEICLLPFTILSSIADRIRNRTNLHDYKTFIWFYFLSNTLLVANSLMNPFLYAWRLPKYRKAFQYILSQLKKKLFISQVQPWRQEAVSCSNTRNEVDVQDCVNNEGRNMGDTRL